MSSTSNFMREYMEKLDEIVRGAFTKPDGYAIRPQNQQERDQIAQGLKKARGYNRGMYNYLKGTDSPDQQELERFKQKSSGANSGTVIQATDTGAEKDVGMPVKMAGSNWQTKPINSKTDKVRWGMDRTPRADDGKVTGLKKPSMPF